MKQKAVVTNPGKVYTTYREFANQYGYPDAAVKSDITDNRPRLVIGMTVNILARGFHLGSDQEYLHIVETSLGYRYIIAEGGLRFLPPDPLTIEEKRALIAKLTAEIDEEVALKVGDYARIIRDRNSYKIGSIVRVLDIDRDECPYRVTSGVDTYIDDLDATWLTADDLVRVTPEEARSSLIAQIEAQFNEEA